MDLYCFDFHGVYLGRLDGEGTFFDPCGSKQARVLERGGVYDFEGRYLGRIDAQGSYFGADGTCRGYVRDWHCLAALPPPPSPLPSDRALMGSH